MRVGEGFALGLILVWVGIAMVTELDNETPGLNLMVIGGILLFSALLKRIARNRDAGGLLGLVLALVGVNEYLESRAVDVPVLAYVIIGVGALIVIGSFRGKGVSIQITRDRRHRTP